MKWWGMVLDWEQIPVDETIPSRRENETNITEVSKELEDLESLLNDLL